MGINELSARANATLRHEPESARAACITARHASAVVASVFLLAACAGPSPFTPAAPGDQAQAIAAPAAQSSRPRHQRNTRAQDILAEWGTFGIERRTFGKKAPPPRPRPLPQLPAQLPDYSDSIQEIVDNATCRSCEQKPYHRMVVDASLRHGVPASLIHAVIQKESGYNPKARSHKNARGLMQVTPATARFVGVASGQSLFDPKINIHAGTAYLKYLLGTHDTFDEVLAAYNAGPGNVRKYKGVPPFKETRRYVRDVRKYHAVTAGGDD